jgi:hypothetical protein
MGEPTDCAACQSLLATLPIGIVKASRGVGDWATAILAKPRTKAKRVRMVRLLMDCLLKLFCIDEKRRQASSGLDLGQFRECHTSNDDEVKSEGSGIPNSETIFLK